MAILQGRIERKQLNTPVYKIAPSEVATQQLVTHRLTDYMQRTRISQTQTVVDNHDSMTRIR